MANQVKVGDKIFIPGKGWCTITQILNRNNWSYTQPGQNPTVGTGDILAQPDRNIRNTDAGGTLDMYNSGH